jgi:hypothetical protein
LIESQRSRVDLRNPYPAPLSTTPTRHRVPSVTGNLHFVKIPFTARPHVPKIGHMKFDFPKFYKAVDAKRRERAASWRQVAREIGIGKSTLARMAQNKRPDADGLAALSFWAEVNPADFVFAELPDAAPMRRASGSDDLSLPAASSINA